MIIVMSAWGIFYIYYPRVGHYNNCFIDILDNMRYRYYIQIINKILSIKYNIGISNVTQESILTHMSLTTTTYMSIHSYKVLNINIQMT